MKSAITDFGGKEAVKESLKVLDNPKVSSVINKFVDAAELKSIGTTILKDDKSLDKYRERLKKL